MKFLILGFKVLDSGSCFIEIHFFSPVPIYSPKYAFVNRKLTNHKIFSFSLIFQEFEPFPIIILEDAFPLGFNKIIPHPPEDFEVSKMIVKKLAKFHAANYYLQTEKKYDFTHLNNTYHSIDAVSEMLVGKTMKGLVEFLRDQEEFEEFIPALENFRDNHQKMTLKSYEANQGPFAFNVLNHADFHAKNVLWKLNKDEKIEDVCVVSRIKDL